VARSRLLLTVHTGERGGASLMALEEARFLARTHDLVIAVGPGPLRKRFAQYGRVVGGVPSVPLWSDDPVAWLKRGARTFQHAARLARLIRRERIGLVLVNSTVSVAPVLAARLAGVPVVVRARDTPFSRLAPLVMALHARLAHTIAPIAAVNEGYLPARRRARVVRVPDGIAIPAAPAAPLNGFGRPLRLCVVGAITPDKGQGTAVAALAALRDRGVAAELDLVGRVQDEAMAAALLDEARKLGIEGRVRVRGETDGIDAVLEGADILLLTSRGEGTPLVLMEALARHTPVVASAVGGVPEIVRDGETGLLVAPGDAGALADAVARLAAEPAAARAMAARGRGHVEARFAMEPCLARLREVVDEALAARKPRARRPVGRSWKPSARP
jgi:glycosyltransferase involved in cell wall biosynthesis